MAKFLEIANGYALRLRTASDKTAEVEKIAGEINDLVYTSTNEPLSAAAKTRLVEMVQGELFDPQWRDPQGRTWILKESDNKRYLELVKALNNLL